MERLEAAWQVLDAHGVLGHGAVLLALAVLLGVALGALCGGLWLARRRNVRSSPLSPGLLQAAAFERAVSQAAMRCDQDGSGMALLWLHVDGFSALSENLGQHGGDQVLHELAQRMQADTPGLLAATRAPGADFALLIDGNASAAGRVAAALRDRLAQPLAVEVAGRADRVRLTVSVGVAAYPAHGAWRKLPGLAGEAMRSVRDGGGNGWAVFTPQMLVEQRERAALLADLRQALPRGELELFYQPKIDARSMEITAAEALLRWVHPQRGLISPGVFLPLAERDGLIGPIGNWVIEAACAQAGRWRAEGLRMRVAINLSPFQMRQDDMVSRLQDGLRRHKLQPGRFTVEIPESVAMEETLATRKTFERLRRAGLHVAIDDFGEGQTSMAHLHKLPVSELKLDISLVRDLEGDDKARTITRGLIDIAHGLKLRVVAEGVETEAQRDWLVAAGCDELQGFLFARPMPAVHLGLWAQGGISGMSDSAEHGFRASLFKETAPAELI